MSTDLTQAERDVLLSVIDSSVTADDLASAMGDGAVHVADTLVERGLVHRSSRGNYAVTSARRHDVLDLLGEDAPAVPVLEVLSSPKPRGYIEFFNGICDPPTYALMLRDGLHGAREADRGTVEKIQPGDLLLGYVTEPYSEWNAVQRVTGHPFRTDPRLHGHCDLPYRVPADFVVALRPGRGIGRLDAAEAAHALGGKAAPHRHSPERVDPIAARVILKALLEIAGREGSVVPVVELGTEYRELLGSPPATA